MQSPTSTSVKDRISTICRQCSTEHLTESQHWKLALKSLKIFRSWFNKTIHLARIDTQNLCRQLNQHLLCVKTLAQSKLTVVIDSKWYLIWGLCWGINTQNKYLTLFLSLCLPSLSFPGFLTAPGGADGERDPDVWALSAAAAEPWRGVHSGWPAGEHLETGEPLPEPQRLVAEAGDPHQGMAQDLIEGTTGEF